MTGIYKHGTYGEYAESVAHINTPSGTVAVYVGTAPINLVRGYKAFVNSPVRLTDFGTVTKTMGYSANWSSFTLCEAFKAHFDNPAGNVGPIVAINVLNPDIHKKAEPTTKALAFVNGKASFESDTIILDTLVLSELVEGEDFEVSYNFEKGLVIINSIGEAIAGSVNATYSEIDASAVDVDDIIGEVTDGGIYSGLGCLELVYPELGIVPNIVLAPSWSEKPEVYKAMLKAASKINNHWDAIVYADIPLSANGSKVDTIPLAIKWKEDNAYNDAFSKVFFPQNVDSDGKKYHASVLGAWRTMLVDASHDGVPMESPSNKAIPVSAHYFGEGSTNRGFDQSRANELNANGITTSVFWGGTWVLWGPHTAAYKHGANVDNRDIFDNSVRMMMYVSNSFQLEHALTIDAPMTRAMADTIRNREQEKADALAAIGALIGTPVVEFRQSENTSADLVEGNFTWYTKGTPTPPFKSGTLRVAYTSEGFTSYFEGGAE